MAYVTGPYTIAAHGNWTVHPFYPNNGTYVPSDQAAGTSVVFDPSVVYIVARPALSQPDQWTIRTVETRVVCESQPGTPPGTAYRYAYRVLVNNPTSSAAEFFLVMQQID
jgi:hypothetical protein